MYLGRELNLYLQGEGLYQGMGDRAYRSNNV